MFHIHEHSHHIQLEFGLSGDSQEHIVSLILVPGDASRITTGTYCPLPKEVIMTIHRLTVA